MPSKDNLNAPTLSVIIPTKDRGPLLNDHLCQLIKTTGNFYVEIIIVNDSEKPLDNFPNNHNLIICQNPRSGVASARNFGASLASSDLLLFLDDDMVLMAEHIDAVIKFHKKNRNAFLNLNWIYPPSLESQLSKIPFGRFLKSHGFNSLKGWNKDNKEWRDNEIFQTFGITSQNLSVPRKTFHDLGGYNENFPYAGFEDQELSQRINSAGHKIYIDPTQMTYHDESDRMELKLWLKRKYRGGITRKVAVHFGFTDYTLNAGIAKKGLIRVIHLLEWVMTTPPFKSLCTRLPDILYFPLINALLASSIYRGYFSREAQKYIQ
ncbi:MAG: glycosyltransferase [Cyclobacteriaceae bacterium]|nr:glycosyltransferase [Cyclobacteriaceae bacterium]